MFCPSCGKDNEIDQRFCRACGLNLEPAAISLREQRPDTPQMELQRQEDRSGENGCVESLFGLDARGDS
jgi:hypothetical protein